MPLSRECVSQALKDCNRPIAVGGDRQESAKSGLARIGLQTAADA